MKNPHHPKTTVRPKATIRHKTVRNKIINRHETVWAEIRIERESLLFAGLPIFTAVYIFTPWKPIQFLMFFFIFLILFSRACSEYLIRHLKLRRSDSDIRGFRHEWIEAELTVENHGALPAFMLAVTETPGMLPVFRGNKYLATLYGKRSHTIRWQGFGTNRGLFVLGPGVIRGADPLGLFPFTLTASGTTRLFVYPAPGYITLRAADSIPLGVISSSNPFNEDLTRRRSVREYNGGDELRRINWKASARAQAADSYALMVNEYEASLSYPLVVFLNADPMEYAHKNREYHLERAIEAAAALCVMVSRERQALGLTLHCSPSEKGESITPSAFTLIPILERLAVFERRTVSGNAHNDTQDSAESEMPGSVQRLLVDGKTLPFGTRLVYVGPSLESAHYRLLEGLKKSRVSLEYLLIDEKSLSRRPGHYQIKERGYEII